MGVAWSCTDIEDLFTATPGTLLENHVPNVGASWSRDLAPSLAIDGSRLLRSETASGNTSNYHPLPQPGAVDYVVLAQFIFDPALNQQFWQISTRTAITNTDLSGYCLFIQQQRAPDRMTVKFAKAGAILFTSAAIPLTAGDAPVFEMLVSDALKGIALNGRILFQTTDNALVATGLMLRGLSDNAGPVKGDLALNYLRTARLNPATC